MKLFLLKFLLFTFVGLLCSILFYYTLSTFHSFPPRKMYYNQEFNKAFNKLDYDLIGLGNSKFLSSIDSTVLERELNLRPALLAYSSSNISISKLTLEAYLNKCIKTPSVVLLEVSWFSFNDKRTGFSKVSGDLFLEDYHIVSSLFRYPDAIVNLSNSSKREIISFIIPTKDVDYGKRAFSSNENFDNAFSEENFNKLFPTGRAGIDSILFEDFYSIVNLCRDNGIVLILFNAPEGEKYASLQKDNKQIVTIFSAASEIDNVFYFDYTKGGSLYQERYESWLRNSHHLREDKKVDFTLELAKDIKRFTSLDNYNFD